jgi:hypothetical protein
MFRVEVALFMYIKVLLQLTHGRKGWFQRTGRANRDSDESNVTKKSPFEEPLSAPKIIHK